MQKRVNVLLACGVLLALDALLGSVALADPDREEILYGGEDRWVPSLAITGGAIFQDQDGFANSVLFRTGADTVPLQGPGARDDLVFGAFVGAALEVMTPALPIPTRPRFFLSGEILPTFSSDRNLVAEGKPDCVRGPEADAPCAVDEGGTRDVAFPFGEDEANGQGTEVESEIQTLTFGASLGMAFPFRFGERQIRFKPQASWLSYKVDVSGLVVNADCLQSSDTNPDLTQCTTTFGEPLFPGLPPRGSPGFLRQPESLSASDSRRFHGIGPGFDLEVDTGRFGPIGSALFLGGRAYRILGDRTISFGSSATYNDLVCNGPNTGGNTCPETAVARFKTKVDSWMWRAHVGIRLQWLGGFDFGFGRGN